MQYRCLFFFLFLCFLLPHATKKKTLNRVRHYLYGVRYKYIYIYDFLYISSHIQKYVHLYIYVSKNLLRNIFKT